MPFDHNAFHHVDMSGADPGRTGVSGRLLLAPDAVIKRSSRSLVPDFL